MSANLPKYIYRIDDGFRFTLQPNNKYTMDKSEMNPKYEYEISALTNSAFTQFKHQIRIVEYKCRHEGCGEDESC